MTTYDYDTVDGIAAKINTLEGVQEVVDARRQAARDRGEKLHNFLILNRWFMDEFGQTGIIDQDDSDKLQFAPVVDFEQALKVVRIRLAWSFEFHIPRRDQMCPLCGDGWTLDNIDDLYLDRATADFHHVQCWRALQLYAEHNQFSAIFQKAGYEIAVLSPGPNQYWPKRKDGSDRMYVAPWFTVTTEIGQFTVGWRKRVIDIDWTAIGRDCSSLFEDVTDTKDPLYIHAYSDVKAAEYLRRIRNAIHAKTAKTFEIWSEYYRTRHSEPFLHGSAKGVDFKDACKSFFVKKGHEKNYDYDEHNNSICCARLYPTQEEAKQAVKPT